MKTRFEITDVFNCSIERAFKAPILGDARRFMKGYLFQPAVTAFEEDETWGQVNGVRYPVTSGNLMVKKGRLFKDEILERNENKFWKWTIYDFKIRSVFFTHKAIGEWHVEKSNQDQIKIIYTYTYYSKNIFLHPLTWLFVNIQIKGIMKRAIKGIKKQAESNETFIYETNI